MAACFGVEGMAFLPPFAHLSGVSGKIGWLRLSIVFSGADLARRVPFPKVSRRNTDAAREGHLLLDIQNKNLSPVEKVRVFKVASLSSAFINN